MRTFTTGPAGLHLSLYRILIVPIVALGTLLGSPSHAQTTNLAELRELRISCLESFNSAKTRLDELHEFVGQQSERERSAASQLFQLQQSAASAQRRNQELHQQLNDCTNQLDHAQSIIRQAATSYQAAVAAMPDGESWAADGSAALSELRRAADAAPRDNWKRKRVREAEAEFIETLDQWRTTRRSVEQVSFNLELRAAPSVAKRIQGRIDAVSEELARLESQLAERQNALNRLSSQSEQWDAAISDLREGEERARQHLQEIAVQFHLVDLKFAAWRLKHSDVAEDRIEALLDVREKQPGYITALNSAASEGAAGPSPSQSANTHYGAEASEPQKAALNQEEQQTDADFVTLLARVTLAQARLEFVSRILEAEVSTVESAIKQLEATEDKTHCLADDTARLAVDQESLRRSIDTEQQTLAAGAQTLDLVKKRFAADLKVINHLLEESAAKTKTLEKSIQL